MPKRSDIKKIMVIGSGPIIIGQAAEFDYAGTQACLALKEEGYSVVLVNSNPATIMTDKEIADKVYIEPITLEFLTRILRKERPDALLPTLGGQTGLNMAMELSKAGILEELGVELLGTKLSAIDRDTLPECLMVTHEEINDKSVEGVRHRDFPAFSVQFHPDAAPGPHDASYLFDEFLELIDAFQAEKSRR